MALKIVFNPFNRSFDWIDIPAVASNSFATMQTPSGTSPVADSSIDTLTFSSTDGNIVITGNSTTDTIDLTLAVKARTEKIDTFTSTPQTLDGTHSVVLCNMATAIVINLPIASTCSGRLYHIKNINTGVATITPNGVETIDGSASAPLNRWDSLSIISDGSNWYII